MKYHSFLLGLVAALSTACSVQEMEIDTPLADEEDLFYASIEETSTKVYVDNNLRVLWNADDRVSIFNKYTYNQEYRFTGEEGDNAGSFKKVPGEDFVTGNALDLVYSVYPYQSSTKISNDGVLTVVLPAEQVYRENSFGLKANTMVSVTEDNQLLFKNLCGYLAIKLYGEDKAITAISIKGNNEEPLAGQATVNASVEDVPTLSFAASATREITLCFDTPVTLGTTAETATVFWLVVPPTTFDEGITLRVTDEKGGLFEKSSSKQLEIRRNTLSTMAALRFGKTDAPVVPEAIDLGLPSGIKWASFNLGATAPEEYGYYYAWGEVAPKANYSWSTYKYCDGTSNTMTKYCLDPSYGQVDGLSLLESQDDAASINLGEDWRMPTKEEWTELMNDCSWVWTTVNGKEGYLITGKKAGFTENSIFLPAAGIWDGTSFYPRNNSPWSVAGSYWSSNLGKSNIPYNLDFDIVCPYVDSNSDEYRYTGQSIRPVWNGGSIPMNPVIDLSKAGTANCYIVSSSGSYKFNATVKGNSLESLRSAVSAEVLWESFGTNIAPETGDIIASVELSSDGYVLFATPEELKDGNALIAIKDAVGTVLWSWHIWVCKDFDPEKTASLYANNAGVMMDRNLGALSATPGDSLSIGLLYQWGRKDPFMGSSSLTNTALAAATPAFPTPNATTTTIEYTIEHPSEFIAFQSFDWLNSTNDNRWKEEKTIYDPCPPGWKVPQGGPDGFYATAFGTSKFISNHNYWDSSLHGLLLPSSISGVEAWYPASGARGWGDARLVNVGSIVEVYSSLVGQNSSAYTLNCKESIIYPSSYCTSSSAYDYFHRVDARSVRCVRED